MPSPLVEAGLLPLADLPYDETLLRKHRFVREALSRRGLRATVADVAPSPRVQGARARVKLRAGPGGILGFHRPGSHDFVQVPLGGLAREEIVLVAAAIAGTGTARGEIELRSDGARVVAEAEQRVDGIADLAVRGRTVRGDPALVIDGLRVSPGAFSQVNLEVNRLLRDAVDARLVSLAPEALLDAYGGIGNLSHAAARRGVPVTLLESSPAACADARHNLRGTGARVVQTDAGRFEPGSAVFDVAVVDPPRAGCPGLLPRLALTRPRAILYVSCDPVTLARDLAELRGYAIVGVQPFDMFPGAEHVEVLVEVRRG